MLRLVAEQYAITPAMASIWGHFLTLKYSHSVFSVIWLESRSFVSHLCVVLALFSLSFSSRCYTLPPNAPHEFLICCIPIVSSSFILTYGHDYIPFVLSRFQKSDTLCSGKNTLSLAELNSVRFSIAMLAQPTFKALRAEAKISSLHESQWSLFFLRPGHGDRESQLKTWLRPLDLICSDAFCVTLPCFGVWFYQLSAQKSTICPSLQISSPYMSICERGQNRTRR